MTAEETLQVMLRAACLPVAGVLFLYLATYAAARFLDIVEQTSAGNAEIRWPEDTGIERFLRAIHLAGVAAFWLFCSVGPLWIAARSGGPLFPVLETTVALLVLWLVWPVSLLSSLSGPSVFLLVRPEIVVRLARCRHQWAAFYAFVGSIGAFVLSAWYMALFGWKPFHAAAAQSAVYDEWLPGWIEWGSWWLALPTGVLGAAAGWLIYARLLGRLAWILNQLDPPAPTEPEPPIIPASVPVPLLSPYPEPPGPLPEEIYGFKDDHPPAERAAELPVVDVLPAEAPAAPVDAPAAGPRRLPRLLTPTSVLFPWTRNGIFVWLTLVGCGWIFGVLLRFLVQDP